MTVDECAQIKLNQIAKDILVRRFVTKPPVYHDDMTSVNRAARLVDAVLERLDLRPRQEDNPRGQGIGLTRTACHYGAIATGWYARAASGAAG